MIPTAARGREDKKRERESQNFIFRCFILLRIINEYNLWCFFDIGKAWFRENIQNTCSARRRKSYFVLSANSVSFRNFMNWIIFFSHNSLALCSVWMKNISSRFTKPLLKVGRIGKKNIKKAELDGLKIHIYDWKMAFSVTGIANWRAKYNTWGLCSRIDSYRCRKIC